MQIKPGCLCIVIYPPGSATPEDVPEGSIVEAIKYVGDVSHWYGFVVNAWLCETPVGEAWINATRLKPISDPDSLTDADLLDLNLEIERDRRVAA